MFINEALAQGASGGGAFLIQIAPLVLIFSVVYVLLIRPRLIERKKYKVKLGKNDAPKDRYILDKKDKRI